MNPTNFSMEQNGDLKKYHYPGSPTVQPPSFFKGWFPKHHCFVRSSSSSKKESSFLKWWLTSRDYKDPYEPHQFFNGMSIVNLNVAVPPLTFEHGAQPKKLSDPMKPRNSFYVG